MKHEYLYKGKVIKIIDGDTLDVILDLGFKMTLTTRLRLLGLDAAELHDPLASERMRAQDAKNWLYAKVFDQLVLVRTEKSDSFGRYLAEVYIPEQENSVNYQMLAAGLVSPYAERH